jgi:ketosteroid isomerase-like protein
MISIDFAQTFATQWIEAWNAHDLPAILAHYSEDFQMSSPYIAQLANESSGKLTGKPAVAAYWSKALEMMPNLHFDLLQVLVGADSITIYYRGVRGLAAEVFFFNEQNVVSKACAHYAS